MTALSSRRGAWVLALVGFVLGMGLAITPGATAEASSTAPALQAQFDDNCGDAYWCIDAETALANFYNSEFRAVNRWGGATEGFFTKYDGFIGTQVAEMAQRNLLQGQQLSIGNFFSLATGNMVRATASLDFLDALGEQIDTIVAHVSRIVVDVAGSTAATVLFVALLLGCVLWLAFSAIRGGGLAAFLRRFIGFALIVAALVGMGYFSQTSTAGRDANGTYQPAPLTPTWLVKSVADGVGWLAEAPAKGFVEGVRVLAVATAGPDDTVSPLSCEQYTANMDALLSYSETQAGATSTVATVMDSLWESTGLSVWAQLQTGANSHDSGLNRFGEKMYCRILDMRSTVGSSGTDAYITRYGSSEYSAAVFAAADGAPFAATTNNDRQVSFVAWAACKPTGAAGDDIQWEWEPEWIGYDSGAGTPFAADNADQQCDQWWNAEVGDDLPNAFDVTGESGWINEHTQGIEDERDRAEVRAFLQALVGVNVGAGTAGTWSYMVGSIVTFAAMVWMCLLVLFAKLMLAFFALVIWFVLLKALFSLSPMEEVILPAFRRFLGSAVFASIMTLVMTLVVVISRIISQLGSDIFGASNVFTMLWIGLSPVAALVLIHVIFKMVLKQPSPLSIAGARGWGRASSAGAIGGAMAAGGVMMRRMARKAGKAALSKATGGRLGSSPAAGPGARRSSMTSALKKQDATLGGATTTEARDIAAAENSGTKPTIASRFSSWREGRVARAAELNEAREFYRQTTGDIAPSDFRTRIGEAASSLGRATRERASNAGAALSGAIATSAVMQAVENRRAARMLRESGEDSPEMAEHLRRERQRLSSIARATAAAFDSPAAAAARARIGGTAALDATSLGAQKLWNSNVVTDARIGAQMAAADVAARAQALGRGVATGARAVADTRAAGALIAGSRIAAQGASQIVMAKRNNDLLIEHYRAHLEKQAKAEATSRGRMPVERHDASGEQR